MRTILLVLLFLSFMGNAQTNTYQISFENAVHHEAKVNISFPEVKTSELSIRMSRTSPGRYALHEFVKNVYGFKATNSQGKELTIERTDPYSWKVSEHDGTVNIEYILFANRGDGTYSQIDETHAHLNIPATFMYAEEFQHRPIEVNFEVREDLNWKVATQLKQKSGTTYTAPDLYYFMDSPTEISGFDMKSFNLDGQEIQFALHHKGTEEEFSEYFRQVMAIIVEEMEVYGELPDFDYDKYTFLACYMPNVSGDGMEHRNSTILTDKESLAEGGMKGNIGTVAHEFFHAWNVERIRPAELEPFDFSEANMTGSLWFAEGFTSYYTGLMLCRANVTTPKEYIEGLAGTFNYVWNSPALEYFNPIEMSYQAPFVDAATSVDPTNRENTFISYYSYGSILGLALDLSLRDQSKMPNYQELFKNAGIKLEQEGENYFGASVKETDSGLEITRKTFNDSPANNAGLAAGDIIFSLNGTEVKTKKEMDEIIQNSKEKILLPFFSTISKPFSSIGLKLFLPVKCHNKWP